MKTIFRNILVSLIFLLGGAAVLNAQPTVRGQVTDADGLPLPGVAVLVSGTTNGTLTDDNGYYDITVKKGDVIIFSM